MNKEKKYYLSDIESGVSYEVTKEEHDSYYKMLEQIWPKVNPSIKHKGQIIVISTAEEIDNNFKKLWQE